MPRTPGLSADDIAQRWNDIIDLAQRGVAPRLIAERIGVSPGTVYRIQRQYGLLCGSRRPFTDDELEQAEAMLSDGCSIAETARTLGRSTTVVWRRFRGRGWTREQVIEWQAMLRTAARELGM